MKPPRLAIGSPSQAKKKKRKRKKAGGLTNKSQTGSSAMSFKQNPMRSERIRILGRKLSNTSTNFSQTFSSQWLERSLDDSSIRRIDIPEMFLLSDSLLTILDNVTDGLVVFPAMIESQLQQELPFMAGENIIMKLVSHNISRQEAHEQLRLLSRESVKVVKGGGKNNLIELIKTTEFFVGFFTLLSA